MSTKEMAIEIGHEPLLWVLSVDLAGISPLCP